MEDRRSAAAALVRLCGVSERAARVLVGLDPESRAGSPTAAGDGGGVEAQDTDAAAAATAALRWGEDQLEAADEPQRARASRPAVSAR